MTATATTISVSLLLVAVFFLYGANSAVFTVRNNCGFTVWPAANTNSAGPTGFELQPGSSQSVTVPAPWSGRFWGRTQCSNSGASCQTGDGGNPPASLVEFTLAGANGLDFYDVSLVDGFNLPVSVGPAGGGSCPTTSCGANLNGVCPNELAVKGANGAVIGCKSACLAFNQPQYCCTGAFGSPTTCTPTSYSQIFKSRCPQAYSYAYDDRTSTFTCPTGGNYVITFCP